MADPDHLDWQALKRAHEDERRAIADEIAADPGAHSRIQEATSLIKPMPGAVIAVVDIDDGWEVDLAALQPRMGATTDLIDQAQLSEDVVIVGGQALNAWMEHYVAGDSDLQDLGPFATTTIDVVGRQRHVDACARALGGTVIYPSDDQNEIAVVSAKSKTGKELQIHFLRAIAGVTTSNLELTAIRFAHHPSLARVIHPVLLLDTSLAGLSAVGIPPDEPCKSTLKAAALICGNHIAAAARESDRVAINMIERVAKIVSSDDASRLWLDHDVDLSDPVRDYIGLPDEYRRIQLPALRQRIETERKELARLQARRR